MSGRISGRYELTPPVVPVRDIFLPKQNRYLLDGGSLAFAAAASGNCRDRGAVLAPPELATIDPHPVQNHGQAPGDGDDGSTHPAFSRRHTGSSRTVSSSIAPASEVILPPSNPATTARPSTRAKPKRSALHSVCIGLSLSLR